LLTRANVNIGSFTWPFSPNELDKGDLLLTAATMAFVGVLLLFRKNVRLFAFGFAALIIVLAIELPRQTETTTLVHIARNFFGVKKVTFDPSDNTRTLLHGDTIHGRESLNPDFAGTPRLYYYEDGPFGDVMNLLDQRLQSRVAVVGLGTGTIAAYANATRHVTFFDIDPQILDIAHNDFSFIRRCGANCDIVVGDGRLSIQSAPDAQFDLIVLDAFNSDSIPAHLISREAVRMYMSKLRPDGVLLFHVSNRYLDVQALAAVVAHDEDLPAFERDEYVAAVRNREGLDSIRNREQWTSVENTSGIQPWTDDYSNMLSVIRW
jgi:spermidine synthase